MSSEVENDDEESIKIVDEDSREQPGEVAHRQQRAQETTYCQGRSGNGPGHGSGSAHEADGKKAPVVVYPTSDEKALDILARYRFTLGKTLGEGSYARVKKARYERNETHINLAAKIINRSKAPKDFLDKFLPREIEICCRLNHDNIVKTQSIFEIGSRIYIFMELAEGGDLLDFIRSRGALSDDLAKRMFIQIVSAMSYMHDNEIVHRDLKCENILLDDMNNLKITDFGFARYCVDSTTGNRVLSHTYCGSAAYAAPEILQGLPYNPKMYDVWSMGVILYIMVTGSMPYDDSNIRTMLRAQLENRLQFPSRVSAHIPRACKDLVRHILSVDITKRATVKQIKRASWMQDGNASRHREQQEQPGPSHR